MARSLAGERVIGRPVDEVKARHYDLAVVGGGIYGACVARRAAQRGLRVVLLEAADFGSGASGNSLRILHGGLRYLQSADFPRFFESVAARRWFARMFPALVEPLPCLMPLYADGLKRRSIMRVALAINDRLSAHRNDQVAARLHLPQSSTFGVKSTKARFNAVRQDGLEGSALWYDYRMRSSERVLMEVLRSASALGARALNYAKAVALNSDHGAIRGIVVEDQVSGERFEVRANRVCNCIGSYTRAFSAEHDRDNAKLFTPSLAFNVLFSCAQLSDDALAVAAPEPRAPVYFLCPSPLGIWAGTEHVGRPDGCLDASVTEMELQDFMRRINAAIPSLQLSRDKVRRVCSGLLPVRSPSGTDLTAREVIVDHGRTGGLRGLYSVIGIKFTTVQTVAARAIDAMLGSSEDAAEAPRADDLRLSSATSELIDGERVLAMGEDRALEVIRDVATEEAALSSDDFILRRCNWTFTASDLARLQALADKALGPTKSTAGRLGILSSYG